MNQSTNQYLPGITVVIPVYNRPQQVCDIAQDVIRQAVKPSCVIFVDNGSDESTAQSLVQIQGEMHRAGINCKCLYQACKGAPAARNTGLEAVETEWVMFFDSDDNMRPEHIQRAMAAANENPQADIIGWDVDLYCGGKKVRTCPFTACDAQYNNLMHGTMATQRYMARTRLVKGVGGWNNDVKIWNDIELGARLLQRANKVVRVADTPTVVVNRQPDSITGPSFSSRKELYEKPLQAIYQTIGVDKKAWILLKAMILVADIHREKSPVAKAYKEAILRAAVSSRCRLLLKVAYAYRSAGGRATARLLRPFL